MKYLKGTQWMEPYVASASRLVPLHRVVNFKAFRVPLNKTIQTDGSCQPLDEKRKRMTISIRLWTSNDKRTRHAPIPLVEALDSLAHELAHIKQWEHTPKHTRLQARIMKRFSEVAQNLGVKDMYMRNYNV